MYKLFSSILFVTLMLTCNVTMAQSSKASPDWSLNATIIEACSCPMFCQCYFNTKPAGHAGHSDHHAGGEHFCRFNNAFKVNHGNFGTVKLDNVKFWVAGDLGGDFSMGQMDWAVLTFEPSATKEQRDGIVAILTRLYPVKWNSFSIAKDGNIQWNATRDRAEARIDGGKTAEVVLQRYPGMSNEPIVIHNLKYWGAPRNKGFIMMPNEVEAYRIGEKPFEYKGTNGFMITFDISSKDIK